MDREKIIKLIWERIDSPEKEKFLAEIEPEEKGTTTDYLWISGVLPCINTWYDGQLDISFMHHSIYVDRKEKEDKYMLHEDSAEKLRGEINEEIISLILRTIPKRLDWKARIFHSVDELYSILKDLGVLEKYKQKTKERKSELNLLKNPNLRIIKFQFHRSWETGIEHWILKEEVSKEIFNILKKNGLFYHPPDVENEERFKGYCFRAGNPQTLKIALAKEGIRVQ